MKTVKVRIAVAVDPNGDWGSYGDSINILDDEQLLYQARSSLADGEVCYWLTAELPIPEVESIVANVEKAE